ncbi:hypothetical protein B0F90DRAFT_1624486 [Multifurca ochricompacta]|uniref:BTB domain-containing protein n=1 Tax=Multifurca ochricompacta TaxID=376703 RepID=A0AAD4QQU0_9AGAM|nr:hypothetical protein B0F90DRAFT_1624486 [Multifurca ochricompacta]
MSLGSSASPLSSNGHHGGPPQLRAVSPEIRVTRHGTPPPGSSLGSGIQRRPSLSFEDGNIAVLAEKSYFLVHRGFLSRQSEYLGELIRDICSCPTTTLEGRPVLHLPDSSDDISLLLHSMYDGLSSLMSLESNLRIASILLRLSARYAIEHLFNETLAVLHKPWPTSLAHWTRRERQLPRVNTKSAQEISLPHPITIVNLAREVDAPELIPAAFYDLCRLLPSLVAAGYTDPFNSTYYRLTTSDLVLLLQGREAASRFFSTFIVNELENRRASDTCFNRRQQDPAKRRLCTGAFQLITFELLQDVNGLITGRTADPLLAMQDVLNLQADPGTPEARNMFRACDACRQELTMSVHAARNKFWDSLPEWFGVEVTNWG